MAHCIRHLRTVQNLGDSVTVIFGPDGARILLRSCQLSGQVQESWAGEKCKPGNPS